MRALNDVVERGWVRYIGASSMAAWQFQQLQHVAEKHGWHQFISMQNLYNLLYREEEREMIPYCHDTGVGLVPWYPLASGLLTRPLGEMNTERAQTDRFRAAFQGASEADKTIINRLEEVAKNKGVSMAQVALAWLLSKKDVSPIVGLSKKHRIDEAVAAVKIQLTGDEIKYLEEPYVPRPVRGYS